MSSKSMPHRVTESKTQRLTQVVWHMEQRMNALEASMFDFATRQRAMEELMTLRKLMTPDDFNATCQRTVDEIKEMQADARLTDGPSGGESGPHDSRGASAGPGLVAATPGVASDHDADALRV